MRLTDQTKKDRAEFLLLLFRTNPKLSVRKTQAVLLENFGRTMRAPLMQEIRRQAVKGAR